MSTTTLYVLGASDPEMSAIESLLADAGVAYAYAMVGESRVHPGNAYRCDTVDGATHYVECSPEEGHDVVTIDHHRPGDSGFGRPPEEFFSASSVGQVWGSLGILDAPARIVIAAAADHCLGDAYRGRCPGVCPIALASWRAESRAEFQGRPVADVVADVVAAKTAILDHLGSVEYWCGKCNEAFANVDGQCRQCDGELVVDMTGEIVPELPEAACQLGQPVLAGPLGTPDGRQKIVLQAACPSTIKRFLAGKIAPELVDRYGDPARGFAGGYVKG